MLLNIICENIKKDFPLVLACLNTKSHCKRSIQALAQARTFDAKMQIAMNYPVDEGTKKARPSFREHLKRNAVDINGKRLAIITEYKTASPSKGIICQKHVVEDVAKDYAQNGAAAISILTEKKHFHGDLGHIDRANVALNDSGTSKENNVTNIKKIIPILRKDFIFDPLQIIETTHTTASALLLIVAVSKNVNELRLLRELARQHGIEAVVEIFDEKELSLARASGAKIIQVNARNLDTLEMDKQKPLDIINNNPPKADELWILASGIENYNDLMLAVEAGYQAVLVGTSLMKEGQPKEALSKLLQRSCING